MQLERRSGRFAGLLAALAAVSTPAEAVINGAWSHYQWPAVGYLIPHDITTNGYGCSGVAIAPDWVLTAAHCGPFIATVDTFTFDWFIDNRGCGGWFGSISEVYIAPDDDVALLHLVDGCLLPLTPFMLNDQAAPPIGTALYDGGWGVDGTNGNSCGPAQACIGITTVSAKSGLTADQIAFTGTNLFCTHDDGGPHFDYGSNGFPVAYAIFSYGDAGCSQYNVSVRTDALIAFITSHVSQVCLRSNPTGPYCDGLFRNGFDPALN